MASALRVMTEKGYYGSTMDDIVLDSKMSKGAIYHYYKSKKEVYLDSYLRRFMEDNLSINKIISGNN